MERVGTSYCSLIGNVIPEGMELKMTGVRQDKSPSNPIRSGSRENYTGALYSDLSETTVSSFVTLPRLIIERIDVKRQRVIIKGRKYPSTDAKCSQRRFF